MELMNQVTMDSAMLQLVLWILVGVVKAKTEAQSS